MAARQALEGGESLRWHIADVYRTHTGIIMVPVCFSGRGELEHGRAGPRDAVGFRRLRDRSRRLRAPAVLVVARESGVGRGDLHRRDLSDRGRSVRTNQRSGSVLGGGAAHRRSRAVRSRTARSAPRPARPRGTEPGDGDRGALAPAPAGGRAPSRGARAPHRGRSRDALRRLRGGLGPELRPSPAGGPTRPVRPRDPRSGAGAARRPATTGWPDSPPTPSPRTRSTSPK